MEENEGVREAARQLAARRKRVIAKCAYCGKEFEGTARRRYCSRSCANKRYYESHKVTIRQRQREAYRRRKGLPPEGQGSGKEGER